VSAGAGGGILLLAPASLDIDDPVSNFNVAFVGLDSLVNQTLTHQVIFI
jgi:hypothetical protein